MITLLIVFALLVCGIGAVWYRFYSYRKVSFIQFGRSDDMGPFPLEGYSDKQFYFQGEDLLFYIHSEFESGIARIFPFGKGNAISEFSFGSNIQPHSPTDAEQGCNWKQ